MNKTKVKEYRDILIVIFFTFCIFLYGDLSQKDREFFRLLRKLDSIQRHKRADAYKRIVYFIMLNPEKKYLNILKNRTKRVPLEQKLALENIIEKFTKLLVHRSEVEGNNFFKECPDKKIIGLDFLAGTKSFYDDNFAGGEQNISEYERARQLFLYYIGFTKAGKFLLLEPGRLQYYERTINEILSSYKQVAKFGGPVKNVYIDFMIDSVVDLYLLSRNKKATRKVANYLLEVACLNTTTYSIIREYDYKRDLGDINVCENFLNIFGSYVSKKFKSRLKDRYKGIIIKIKSGSFGNELLPLVVLDRNLSAILKFKVFPQASVYQSIIRSKIKRKLYEIRNICKRVDRILKFKDPVEDSNITKYLKGVNEYRKIIDRITTMCLILYTKYERYSYNMLLLLANNPRGGGLGLGVVVTNEPPFTPCDIDKLIKLSCSMPLYALRIALLSCKSKGLIKNLIFRLINYNSYVKNCRTGMGVIYDFRLPDEYLQLLKSLGKIKMNIPYIIKDRLNGIISSIIKLGDPRAYNDGRNFISAMDSYIVEITMSLSYLDENRKKRLTINIMRKLVSQYIKNFSKVIQKNTDISHLVFVIVDAIYRAFVESKNTKDTLDLFRAFLEVDNIRRFLYIDFLWKVIDKTSLSLRNTLTKVARNFNGYELFSLLVTHKIIMDYLLRVTSNVIVQEGNIIKEQAAFFTLMLGINNAKIQRRLIMNSRKLFNNNFKKIRDGIIEEFLYINMRYPYYERYQFPLIEIVKMEEAGYNIIFKSIFFKKEVFKYINKAFKNICKYLPARFDVFMRYLQMIINIAESGNLDEKYKKLFRRIIRLFPIALSMVNHYIQPDKNLYFSSLDVLKSEGIVNYPFCKGEDCIKSYEIEFLEGTSNVVRDSYTTLLRSEIKINRRIPFYVPLIVDIKAKKIIISDFDKINKFVFDILRSKRQ